MGLPQKLYLSVKSSLLASDALTARRLTLWQEVVLEMFGKNNRRTQEIIRCLLLAHANVQRRAHGAYLQSVDGRGCSLQFHRFET